MAVPWQCHDTCSILGQVGERHGLFFQLSTTPPLKYRSVSAFNSKSTCSPRAAKYTEGIRAATGTPAWLTLGRGSLSTKATN